MSEQQQRTEPSAGILGPAFLREQMARIDRDMAETAQLCAERRKLMAERLKLEAEQLRRGRGWLPPDLLGLALVVGAVAGLVPWLLPGACSR